MKVHWIRPVSFLTKNCRQYLQSNLSSRGNSSISANVSSPPLLRILRLFIAFLPRRNNFDVFWIATSPLEDRILYPVLIQEWILLPFESLTQILVKNFATICVESSLPGEIIVLSFVSSLLVLRKNFAGICVQSSLLRGRILLQLHRVSSPWENNFCSLYNIVLTLPKTRQ